jgi:uncharacterized membrane protein
MSLVLKERTGKLAPGHAEALCSLPLFDHPVALLRAGSSCVRACARRPDGPRAGLFMKLANATMSAESIFFYMAVSGLLVPVAVAMTDMAAPINWGPKGRGSRPRSRS